MLVDQNGVFITQRTRKELTRFEVRITANGLGVKDRETKSEFTVKPEEFVSTLAKVEIWEDEVLNTLMNLEASRWFSQILSEQVRLVKINPANNRRTKPKHHTKYSQITSFADSLPILLCGTASFKAVEEDYGPYNWLRFRPNIIVNTTTPFEEDFWDTISINDVEFENKKRCARCNLIMLDPETALVDKEFLGKLSRYRTHDNLVYFGIQTVPLGPGTIQIGDSVTTFAKTDHPNELGLK
jgi:uncharacterized protein YcbX